MGMDEVVTLRALMAHRREAVDPAIAALKSGRNASELIRAKSSDEHRSSHHRA